MSGLQRRRGGTYATFAQAEPWLDKRRLAGHLGCGIRWIEARVAEGMPCAIIAGRRKFRVSEVEQWLERAGHLRRSA